MIQKRSGTRKATNQRLRKGVEPKAHSFFNAPCTKHSHFITQCDEYCPLHLQLPVSIFDCRVAVALLIAESSSLALSSCAFSMNTPSTVEAVHSVCASELAASDVDCTCALAVSNGDLDIQVK